MPAAVRAKKPIYDSTDELILIHRARQGDEDAFRSLYDNHRRQVVMTITRMVKDDDAADEAATWTFFKAWKALPKFNEAAKFSTWLMSIATNEALMHLRISKRRQQYEASLDSILSAPEDGDPSNSVYAERWLAIRDLELEGIADRQLLERALQQVSPKLREVLHLRFWEGMSLGEIQDKMNKGKPKKVSTAAMKSYISRGRHKLMEQVEQMR